MAEFKKKSKNKNNLVNSLISHIPKLINIITYTQSCQYENKKININTLINEPFQLENKIKLCALSVAV